MIEEQNQAIKLAVDALDSLEDTLSYVPEYFVKKHKMDEDLNQLRARLNALVEVTFLS